ncbi:MAG: DUF4153 domain-containing protein [Gammaproteobacteria bacterium]
MNDSPSLPRVAMLTIAVVQGLLLFALYRAFDTGSWPSESPLWSFPLWTLVVALPLLFLLSLDRGNAHRVSKMVAVSGVVLALLAIYTGWQAEPFGEFPLFGLIFAFICSVTLACFKALMYLQQRANQVPLTYQVLFTNSWRNFLVTALSALFVLIFWLILMLWGALFKVIEIDFFQDLFTEDWFAFPILGFAFGLGVIIFRNLTRVIDNITKLLHGLIKLLLPLIVAVAIIFIAALPFVGLDALWATGNGTALLLWLLAIILFFTNAVYQDGRETNPYSPVVHRLIFIGLCVMPVISALSLYGLVLRLNQYGWSVERCWAFVVWLILTLLAAGYVTGIVRRRAEWTADLARVNTGMGLVVLAIMLLANSPLLDFRKVSLNSQLNRAESGEIELKDFDFWYAENQLARPGYLALEAMKQEIGDSDPELLRMIKNPVNKRWAQGMRSTEEMWAAMLYRPEAFDVPQSLKSVIDDSYSAQFSGDPVMFQVDLDDDGQNEYVLLFLSEIGIMPSWFFYQTEKGWAPGSFQGGRWLYGSEKARDAIKNGEIEVVDPRFRNLKIGDVLLQPVTN